jgi:hypothetical protein
VAREGELTSNPLVDYGKGKIWDIAFDRIELMEKYQKLLSFRVDNLSEVNSIASWYKKSFFIEPTEENISNIFNI